MVNEQLFFKKKIRSIGIGRVYKITARDSRSILWRKRCMADVDGNGTSMMEKLIVHEVVEGNETEQPREPEGNSGFRGHEPETRLSFRLSDRYISIQKAGGGYDYTVYDIDCRELDGGVYDGPDITIGQVLDEIVAGLKKPAYRSKLEGNIRSGDELVSVDYDSLMEKTGQAVRAQLEKCVRNRDLQVEERTSDANRDVRGQDEADMLAAEIDEFSYDFDIYEYMDTVEDREAHTAGIAADIRSGNVGYIAKFLNAAISDNILKGITEVFGNGEDLDESDGMQNARKAKGLLDRLAECGSHERDQETGVEDEETVGAICSVKSFDNIPYL